MRNISVVDVAVAVMASVVFAVSALVAFTMFCWKAGAAVGELPAFPIHGGFLGQRDVWLVMAVLSFLLAWVMGEVVRELSGLPIATGGELSAPVREAGRSMEILN